MARFIYMVQDSRGETVSGVMDSNDENEAITALQSKGYFILSLSPEKTSSTGTLKQGRFGGKVGMRELVFFAEQLATLLNGGVPLVRSLSLLGEHAANENLRMAIAQVTKDVGGGAALYRALGKHDKIFDNLWISLVQAGEMGGQLPKVLRQIGAYLEAQAELKGKIVTALAYPAVLGTMSVGVLAFFIIKIVPVFGGIFESFHMKLPPLTAFIIWFSDMLVHHLAEIIFISIGLWFMWRAYTSTEKGQFARWKMIFWVPFFGDFIKNLLVERLLTTLSTLIESGVSILNALSVLELVFAKNIVFASMLKSVKNDVAGGKSISTAFRKGGILPPLVTEMMLMGEESGKLPDLLATLSTFYREQIDQFTRRFSAIIDPILVVGIGGIIGVIVISVFLPIFKLSTMGG